MHRTGIEPMSMAWKATMLPLHQLCPHENLWLYNQKQSYCVKKTDWQSESKSAERKRCTKSIANGWQLHGTGIEPMSIAWKTTLLKLHQRCSQQELWLYNEKQSYCVKNWLTIGEKKGREKTLHQNNRQRITIASYGNRTQVNSLESYYATTTPTMLTWILVKIQGVTVLFCKNWSTIGKQSAERERCTKTFTNGWQLHRTGIEPVNSLEGYYATTTPTMLKWTLVKIQGLTVLFCQKLIDDRSAKCRERTQHQNIY